MTAKTRKKRKTWIIWLVVVLVLAGALLGGRQMLLSRVDPLANVRNAKATTGSIAKTITGTGTLSAEDTTSDVTVLDGLQIDQVLVSAGDTVQADTLIATFDAESLQNAIWNAQASLASIDVQLSAAKDKTESQYINTAVAGRIKQILISEGEDIQAVMSSQGALIVLSLDGKMHVTLPQSADISLDEDDKVVVTLSDGTVLEGTVTSLAGGQCTVSVSDKAAPVGDRATVSLDGQQLGSGTLTISQPLTITGTDGVAADILYSLNAKVSSGAKLIKLETAPVSQTYQKLYAQRLDQADDLATFMRYARDGGLQAGSAGEVLTLSLTEDQTTGVGVSAASAASSAASSAAATIRTASDIQLSINIDELDIAVLAVGQPAEITLDALSGLKLPGAIVEIADKGVAGQSGSTFTVKVDVPEDSRLRLGMTATAVITAEKHDNIVKLPLEALQESGGEQYVYVGTAVSALDLGTKRVVKTGISDGEYVEITEGLKDGETVNYYYATGDSSLLPFQGGGFRQPTSTTAD